MKRIYCVTILVMFCDMILSIDNKRIEPHLRTISSISHIIQGDISPYQKNIKEMFVNAGCACIHVGKNTHLLSSGIDYRGYNYVQGPVEGVSEENIDCFKNISHQWLVPYYENSHEIRRLKSHGYREGDFAYEMELDPKELQFKKDVDLQVKKIEHKSQLTIFCEIIALSFKIAFEYVWEMNNILFDKNKQITQYLGYANNIPVAAILCHETSETFNIVNIGVLPQHQGKGYASTLISNVIKNMQKPVMLRATSASKPVYHKLGFRQYGLPLRRMIYSKNSIA